MLILFVQTHFSFRVCACVVVVADVVADDGVVVVADYFTVVAADDDDVVVDVFVFGIVILTYMFKPSRYKDDFFL